MDKRPGTRAAGQPPDGAGDTEPDAESLDALAPTDGEVPREPATANGETATTPDPSTDGHASTEPAATTAGRASTQPAASTDGHATTEPDRPTESTAKEAPQRPTARSTGEPSPLVSRRALRGDNTSFALLIEHYDPHLRALAAGLIGEPGRVDRVLEDAYTRAYRALPRLAKDATPAGWLSRATYLACVDDLRRTHRRRESRGDGHSTRAAGTDGAPGDRTSTDTKMATAVQRTLATLTPEERAALLFVDGEGFGHRTVAEMLAIDQGAVPRLLAGARAALLTVVDDDPLVALDHGDALRVTVRSLPVPEHGPDFWNRVGALLLREREQPAVSTLDPFERLAARPPQDGSIPVEWMQGSVAELARQADLVRDAPDRRRFWLIAGGALAVAAVVGVALWFGLTAEPSKAVTAREVGDQVTANLSDATYVTGGLTISGSTPTGRTERYLLVHASNGSFRLEGDAGGATFDARAGETRELSPGTNGPASLLVVNGLATGPPDPVGGNRYRFEDDLELIARAFVNGGDTEVRKATRAGHPVWLLSQPVHRADSGVDRIDVSVDRDTAMPVELARYRNGRLVERRRFVGLGVQSTVPAGSFTIVPPLGASLQGVDRGFRHVGLPEAGGAVGYDPITPAWLPDGFELANVAVLRGTRASVATAGVENPPDTDVLSLAYRRGVQQVTVSTRRDGGPTVDWVDPFGTSQGDEVTSVRLQAGRFHGTTVHQVVGDPVSPVHLWGRADGIVFTVAGDVSAADLRRVAESLQ